ncbi:pali-domain-containing protein [Xylariaceae sp. FL0255]|nr:pali-domain-containing protein [Xylariaceae sp. FL0255]
MLRPATPLAILLFAAFVLLLLSVLSTPIIKAIPLGTFNDANLGTVNYGVFGYCTASKCSGIQIGYDLSSDPASDFDLPNNTRSTLSSILIVHPVAALLTLIMCIMSIVAHFHSPSHSSRYLCGLFIFGIVTFLVSLLAFLVDVLLFVPHLAWGSWLVLVATILVFLSFIVSCAMRRTLVGRKARKKRIAENAEMSGENYYNRQAQQEQSISATASSFQPTVPSISGANGPADGLPTFTSYEKKPDDHSSDERIPLTARTPSERSPSNAPIDRTTSNVSNGGRSLTGSAPPSRDQYGNPISPTDAYAMRRGPSAERMNSRGRGGPPVGYRGRGGYGPPGRGGYSPAPNGRGPPGRGGYGQGPNGRGGYGPRGGYGGGMRGGRTPPPPGYPGGAQYDRRAPPPGPYGAYAAGRQMSPAPAAPYDSNPSMPSVSTGLGSAGGYEPYRPDQADDLPRAESPPPLPEDNMAMHGPVGQAVEMDATTGSPAHSPSGFGQFENNNKIRDSDSDVAGMLALQQARTSSAEPPRQEHFSEGSKYSQDVPYVPARQAWNQGPGRASPAMPSPLHIQSCPQEQAPPAASSGGNYYEDVDPRFAEPAARAQQPQLEPPSHFDDPHLGSGGRSPTISERSGFTSVSQRGVNPRWNPPPGQGYRQPMPSRRPVQRNDADVNILNSNPDFELPSRVRGGSASSNRGPAGGMIPDSAYPEL